MLHRTSRTKPESVADLGSRQLNPRRWEPVSISPADPCDCVIHLDEIRGPVLQRNNGMIPRGQSEGLVLTQVPRPSEFAFDVASPGPHCPDQNLLNLLFALLFTLQPEGVVLVGVLGRGEAGTVCFSKQGRGIKVPPSTPDCCSTPLRPLFVALWRRFAGPRYPSIRINASGTMEESIQDLAF